MQSKRNQKEPLSELLESYKKGEKKRKILKIVLTPFLISSLLFFAFWGPLEVPVLSQVGRSILGIERDEQNMKLSELTVGRKKKTKQEKEDKNESIINETEFEVSEEFDTEDQLAKEFKREAGTRAKPTASSYGQSIPSNIQPSPDSSSNIQTSPNSSPKIEECLEWQIESYKRIIISSEEAIESSRAFLANPKIDYYHTDYHPQKCDWNFSLDCIPAADNYRKYTVGVPTAVIEYNYEKMVQECITEKDYCNAMYAQELDKEIAKIYDFITQREQYIRESQDKLRNCESL